ncbi:uncharacterized protein LOC127251937 isoform X2 [Andrographis paniculata]|uniref:uncharacterized protein LOC127251937 isoform X2 n=1 Tax=Andrographis paniculata TaxID=175694 RepID=UPI0021E71DE9|nr:uncharacterized protein LOC127251937 isoform X2 [Andrographis paniculata]
MASTDESKKRKLETDEDDDNEALSSEEDGQDFAESSPDLDMITSSEHYFGSNEDGFSISIIENMKEEYGLFVWPCSIILAEYVWQKKSRFSRANVVELGAGTSLPGLVAAKVGADVTLTDDSNRSEVLANMMNVCKLNNLNCKVSGLTWGLWDANVFALCPNIILGADVLYNVSAFEDLFATVTFLLRKCQDSVFITTYHNRSGHHLIEFLMEKWGLKCTKLLDGFSFLPSNKASNLGGGNIQLAEIIIDASSTQTSACR